MESLSRVIKLAIGQASDEFELVLKSSGYSNDIQKLRKGDLILRTVLILNKKLYHAGIYCGENEVIQFTSKGSQTQTQTSPSCSSCSSGQSTNEDGLVDKISVKKFIEGQSFLVYRLKNGPPENFSQKIMEAMDDNQDYNFFNNNCLHFALRVLGFSPGPMPESPPHDTGAEICMEQYSPLIN